MILAGNVALEAHLLGLGVESIRLAAFVEVSEAPTAGCSVALAVFHHHCSQHTPPLSSAAFFPYSELQHLFSDRGAIGVVAGSQSLHCFFIGVKIKNAIRAGLVAGRL